MTHPPPTYRETVRVRSPWVWTIVVVIAFGSWMVFGSQLFLGRTIGENPPPTAMAVVLLLLFGVGLPYLTGSFRLVIDVDDNELRWAVYPFIKKSVSVREIASAVACTYHPLLEYGGWGIKWMPGRGWAYTIDGKRGLRLRLRSGKKIMLGSRQPDELAAAIERARAAAGADQNP